MYKLTMTKKQAEILADACGFYAELKIGRFNEITRITLDSAEENYSERKSKAEDLLYEARKHLCPGLASPTDSYTMETIEAAMTAYKIHEQARELPKIIRISEEEAKTISVATEVYARVKMGQFNEIIWHVLDFTLETNDYCIRRDEAESLLLKARKYIYPELHGVGHSYGVGRFEDADRAFDFHQVIRHCFGDGRTPFSYHDLPTFERCE